jgi:hypothetical protein
MSLPVFGRKAADALRQRWVVFGVAVVIHMLLVFALGQYRRPVWMESGAIASFMYEGHGFSIYPKSVQPFLTPAAKQAAVARAKDGHSIPFSELHPTSRHSPGYPFVLYLSWKLMGKNVFAYLVISLLQAVMISSLVFPMHWLTSRWFGPKAAAWAMWITCLMPLHAYYATRLLPVAVFIALQPWLLMQWLSLRDRLSLGRATAAGCTTGLAALFQPVNLAVFGLVGLGLLVELVRKGRPRQALLLLAAPCVLLLVLTPWTIRNWRVHGQFVPIRQVSDPFWVGNNPHATGATVVAGGTQDIYVAYPPACITRAGELTECEYHAAMRSEALAYIRAEPVAFVQRAVKKIFWLWTIVPKQYVDRQGLAAAEKYRLLHMGYWFGFVALAIAARLLGGRFKPEYILMLAVYVGVCSLMYGMLHSGQARDRGEIEFIFIPAVAQGVACVWSRISRPTGAASCRNS